MIWIDIVIGLFLVLVKADWIMDTYNHDAPAFVMWTLIWAVAGISFGRWIDSRKMKEQDEIESKLTCEIDRIKIEHADEIADLSGRNQQAIASKDAELQREKEKNAELESELLKLNSVEAKMRETFDVLNERQKWILAAMVDVSPKTFSASGVESVPQLDDMCIEGIVRYTGETEVLGTTKRSYAIAPTWRTWIDAHAAELPDPHTDMPK